MVSNICKLFVLACTYILCSFHALPASAREKASSDLTSQLSKKIDKYELDAGNFGEALVKVASDFQIPMGVEWEENSDGHARLKRSWKNSTALNILREIVSAQPTYKIDVRAGIVRIWSPTLVLENENPLKIVIPRYEVNKVPLEEA